MSRTLRTALWCLAVVVLVAGLAPAIVTSYWTLTLIAAVIFSLAALGVVVLYGQLGLVFLCQVALVGIGGWVTLRLSYATDLPFLVLAAVAGAVTLVVGTLVGLPALRLSGLYLALLTLMAAAGATVLFTATGFPDGGPGFLGNGAVGGQQPMARPNFAQSQAGYLRLCVGVSLVLFVVTLIHVRTGPGRAWAAIKQSEAGALALGINVTLYKLWGIALASLLAGVAGALLAGSIGTLDVALFRPADSIVLFAVVLVSGAYGIEGAILAGIFMKVVPSALDQAGVNGNVALLLFGAGVLQVLVFEPEGLSGALRRLGRRRPSSLSEVTT